MLVDGLTKRGCDVRQSITSTDIDNYNKSTDFSNDNTIVATCVAMCGSIMQYRGLSMSLRNIRELRNANMYTCGTSRVIEQTLKRAAVFIYI